MFITAARFRNQSITKDVRLAGFRSQHGEFGIDAFRPLYR
jgi:hypothetical protein